LRFIASLIQEAGRAGRDGNMATHYIFYSKKDIRTNYSTIAEYRETLVIKNIFLLYVNQKNTYMHNKKNLFEKKSLFD